MARNKSQSVSSQTPLRSSAQDKDEKSSMADEHKENVDKKQPTKGRTAGGKFLEELRGNDGDSSDNDDGPLKEVDMDLPLTLTETKQINGEEVILLKFAPGDKEHPFNWSKKRKSFITWLLNLMTLFIGLATTAYSSGINCMLVGRRIIYAGSYGGFTLRFIGLALGKNIATILIMRTLLGLFGCVGTILVGGTFSDIHLEDERAKPVAFFSYVAILGTTAAPIYSGFINQELGWRWIEGIQGLSNIPLLILVVIFLRETRGGATLQKRAKAMRKATGDERYKAQMDIDTSDLKGMLHTSSVKAVHMLATEPVVFFFGLWIAFAWAVTFLLSVIPITFQQKRGWAEGVGGLPYISLCIGVTLGYCANFLQFRKYDKIGASNSRKALPEHRLYGSMFGVMWLPMGLYLYSFTQYEYLPWIAPTISLAPIAFGIFFVFESCYNFTSDCYGQSASSAVAGQGLMRNTLGGVAPLFATQFFMRVGSQFAGLTLAILVTFLSFIPFVLFKYGHKLRERSKLAKKY